MKEAIKNELIEEFNRGLRYHPLVQRVKGLSKAMSYVIDDAAARMCDDKRTTAKDISEAKDAINILRMSLNTTFHPETHPTVETIKAVEAMEEALNSICPLWPICKDSQRRSSLR